jgi:hypothetical protein
MTVKGPLSAKLLVWCFFRLHGRAGATIGMVARDLRKVGLAMGSQRSARHGVRTVVEQWINKPRGSHRALERISAGRYRATLNGR